MQSFVNFSKFFIRSANSKGGILGRFCHSATHTDATALNLKRRIELATAYRALDKLHCNEGVCNHLTVMTPSKDGSEELMLVVPHGTLWSEVTPSCLLGISKDDEVIEGTGSPELSAVCIHRGARAQVPHLAVMHTHSPYITALGILRDNRLLQLHQNTIRFHGKIAYDRFNGFGSSVEEGQRLGEELKDNNIMIMGNHGVMVAYHSVAVAFDSIYYLERVAQFQMLALATGKPLHELSDKIIEEAVPEVEHFLDHYAQKHFLSYIHYFAKNKDEFKGYDTL